MPNYFLGKYVLNIALIVLMALGTLVFDNGSENIFAVPVACFMGIVSWMFVLAAQTPVLGYNTRLDDFMTLSYLVVFVVVLYSCVRITKSRSRNASGADSSNSVVPYTSSDARDQLDLPSRSKFACGNCLRVFISFLFDERSITVSPCSLRARCLRHSSCSLLSASDGRCWPRCVCWSVFPVQAPRTKAQAGTRRWKGADGE